MTLVNFIWYFSIYSLIGWIWETVCLIITNQKIIDAGFLKGPFCPLYGFSAMFMVLFLSPLQSNFFVFYLSAVLITTIFEYLTAVLLEFVFKIKFWDYSKFKSNFQGRIALIVSLTWGVLSFILIKIIHPIIVFHTNKIPLSVLDFGAVILIIYFLIDSFYSTVSTFNLTKIFEQHNPSLDTTNFSRNQIRLFKAFPQISSKKFDQVKEVSQKINTNLPKT